MSDELRHECGLAAVARLSSPPDAQSSLTETDHVNPAQLIPRMLLDMQTRGQLAAGFATYSPDRAQLIDTYKDVGTVREVFRMAHPEKHASIMQEYSGQAAIGHTRYSTAGGDDARYAQPSSATMDARGSGSLSPLTARWPTSLTSVTDCWQGAVTTSP